MRLKKKKIKKKMAKNEEGQNKNRRMSDRCEDYRHEKRFW